MIKVWDLGKPDLVEQMYRIVSLTFRFNQECKMQAGDLR
jgi:hypothetical protein